mmetsp:Transcript_32894/g.55129  ORF Transcript_32894/g.55129 Transcript_32894/m.55129 type:complete len:208 (+) Transcript_32894:2287-2910(+)
MEDTVCLEGIVGRLPHKHLGETKLNIRLRKNERNRLMLHTSNLFESADTRFLRIQFSSLGLFLPFFETRSQKLDTKFLGILVFHAPRDLFLRNIRQEHSISLEECLVRETDRISSTGNTNCLEDTTVSKLFSQTLSGAQLWFGSVIRFQTSDVVRVCLFNTGNQSIQLFLELLTDGLRLRRSFLIGCVTRSIFGFLLLNCIDVLHQL